MDDWDIIDAPQRNENSYVWDEATYHKICVHAMKGCRVSIDNQVLLFCLEPKASCKEEMKPFAMNLSKRCRTCTHRICKFAHFVGEGGQYHFFNQQEASGPNLDKIRQLRSELRPSSEVCDYHMVVIDEEFSAKCPIQVGPFAHMHFTYEELTSTATAAKIKNLSNYMDGSFENRFQKLVDNEPTLRVIQHSVAQLERPDHWKGVTAWALAAAGKAKGKPWQELAAHQKFELMVCALLSGRSQGAVHLDMQQASNLVDFLELARSNETALRAEMDRRSNPETYQVSQVAELLRAKRVTANCTATLVWGLEGQRNKSDLDLHVKVNGQELYYGNKKVGKCSLDFDANASKVEKAPAENISLNQTGSFSFRVNNFNNRDAADVPFQLIVRKPNYQQVFDGVWPQKRAKGSFITVCTVMVTAEDLVEQAEPIKLSEAEQRKLAAKEEEWAHLFGEVRSTVATDGDLEAAMLTVCKPKAAQVLLPTNQTKTEVDPQAAFSALMSAPAKRKKNTAKGGKANAPETISALLEYLAVQKCRLEVEPRDFSPAYVTKVETATEVLNHKISINTYHRKNELPQLPRADEQPTARFDGSWGTSGRTEVQGFAQIGQVCFMVLKGAHLPNDAAWPIGGGMFPTQLTPGAHHHRSKWATFHSLVAPTSPALDGVPLVGAALVGFPSFRFILDGREITVRADNRAVQDVQDDAAGFDSISITDTIM